LANKVKQTVEHLIEYVSHLFWAISGILIVLMVFSATYGVIRRYAFNNPEPYSYEVSIICLLWCFIFSVAELEKQGRHIRVDIVAGHLPGVAQNILLNIIAPIAGLFVCVILTWRGWTTAWFSLQIGEVSQSAWAVALFPVKIIVPIGYGLLCLVLLTRLYRGITSLKGGTKKLSE
jgi:TRAP-type C4-dicarboxylate transport system permease small subunit